MKKIVLCSTWFLLYLYLLIRVPLVWGDWVQDGGSLNVNAGFSAQLPTIAIFNGTPYVAWQESKIYVKYYNGTTWVQAGGSLNVNTGENAEFPSIAMSNGTPYVSWHEMHAARFQIYVKHYNGSNWVQDGGSLNLDIDCHARDPSIAISNGTPYVTWTDSAGSALQIYVKHYNGSNWIQDGGILNVNTGDNAQYPSIAMSNSTPYVSWQEFNGTTNQIYVKHYNGSNWTQDGGILNVNTGQNAGCSSIAISNGTPYVSWEEQNGTALQIYVKHYNGSNWIQEGGSLNVNTGQYAYSSGIAISNGTPYVTWHESNGTKYQIYVKHYNGSNWIQDGEILNVNIGQQATSPSIAISNGTPYVSWNEQGAAQQIYVKHYVQTTPTSTPTPVFTITHTPTNTPTPGFAVTHTPTLSAPFFKMTHALARVSRGESAKMEINLSQGSRVRIKIYAITGREIIMLRDEYLAVGRHEIEWNGSHAGSGLYLVYCEAGQHKARGKIVVVR